MLDPSFMGSLLTTCSFRQFHVHSDLAPDRDCTACFNWQIGGWVIGLTSSLDGFQSKISCWWHILMTSLQWANLVVSFSPRPQLHIIDLYMQILHLRRPKLLPRNLMQAKAKQGKLTSLRPRRRTRMSQVQSRSLPNDQMSLSWLTERLYWPFGWAFLSFMSS